MSATVDVALTAEDIKFIRSCLEQARGLYAQYDEPGSTRWMLRIEDLDQQLVRALGDVEED